MAGMTWLHLSDWHQQGKDFDRQVVRDALIQDIQEREKISPDLAKVDFIIFSGDLAHAGKKEEYAAAREILFEPLLKVTNLSEEKLFIVPGNHDLDRSAFDLLPTAILQPFESETKVIEWLTDERKCDRLREPFEAYRKFVTEYTGQTDSDYTSISKFPINGKQVALLGLNSALMAARNKKASGEVNDYGELIVGEPQFHEALEQIPTDAIRIAVLHHPLEWIAEFERSQLELRLKNKCHLILCGHQHRAEVYQVSGTKGNCVIIPAGSSYDRRNYPNGYNFVHLDFETRQGTVYLRRWSEQKNHWIKDIESTEDDNGQVTFVLPQKEILIPASTSAEPTISKLLTPEARAKLEAHFKKLVARIKDGLVIPFLGGDINLCDRPKQAKQISFPWSWDINGDYPPTSVELAAYLDNSQEYLKTVRCPLCDSENLLPGCPMKTAIISKVTRLDLQHVSQYLDVQSEKIINKAINDISQHIYKPNCLHRFLAELPRLMDERGYSSRIKGGIASEATRYQLLVSTNFDSTLEYAFVQAKQPFDLVCYTTVNNNGDSQILRQFVHQKFDHEIEGNQESPIVPKGKINFIPPGTAPENLDFSLNRRPVILKLYGSTVLADNQMGSFAITEDHFIDYLADADSHPMQILPIPLLYKLKSSHIWFLGYTLRYWHQRVILHRIWRGTEDRGKKWWAVHPKPDVLDEVLWTANDVELISEMSLENYISELQQRLLN